MRLCRLSSLLLKIELFASIMSRYSKSASCRACWMARSMTGSLFPFMLLLIASDTAFATNSRGDCDRRPPSTNRPPFCARPSQTRTICRGVRVSSIAFSRCWRLFMNSFLRRPEVKCFGLCSSRAGDDCFQMGQTVFDPPTFQCLQKYAGQESNPIGGAKIEGTLPDPIDRFFQQPAHVTDALQ